MALCYPFCVNHYTYRAEWSPDYDEYIGVCLELPFLQERAPTAHGAIAAITATVDQRLVEMQELEQPVPPPLSERSYSGTFVVRTSRALHARLAREAVEQHVSMNQWVVQKLSGRELPSGLSLFGLD
ncbi:HicB family protein [Mycobacterium lentiflavum]|uniref:HicB family protein n=1 Tax=Mycobacterium lentiflavum TaxID=141349 RepID=A0A0E4GVR9_MYCLN|nr:HicB family protein [Mycobacterium lentiflavum]